MKTVFAFLLLAVCFVGSVEASELRLAADHFSRSITPNDTAKFWVEVFYPGGKQRTVDLRTRRTAGLKCQLSAQSVKTPQLIKLEVITEDGRERDGGVQIIAKMGSVSDTLNLWVHVVRASRDSPHIILDAPYKARFAKNLPQSLEGAIVPAMAGRVKVVLQSPGGKKSAKIVHADQNGLFHLTHPFDNHGIWTAWAEVKLLDAKGRTLTTRRKTKFKVLPSVFRLTVAAESLQTKGNRSYLHVKGQIALDYTATPVRIEIVRVEQPGDPQRPKRPQRTTIYDYQDLGKFEHRFAVSKKGVYRITARPVIAEDLSRSLGMAGPNLEQMVYASPSFLEPPVLPARTSTTTPPDTVVDSYALPYEVPAGFAVIIVGKSSGDRYRYHLNMAYLLRDMLIYNRGFRPNDILFATLTQNEHSDHTLVNPFDSARLRGEIEEYICSWICDENFLSHRGLLMFLIGDARDDGAGNVLFSAGSPELNAADLNTLLNLNITCASEYTQPVCTDQCSTSTQVFAARPSGCYHGLVYLFAGDGSGKVMPEVLPGLVPTTIGKSHAISSLAWNSLSADSYLTDCGLTSFLAKFIEETKAGDTVRKAFKGAWTLSSGQGAIDDDLTNNSPAASASGNASNAFFGDGPATTEIKLGYNILDSEFPPYIDVPERSTALSSIAGSPQITSEGTLNVVIDNPNDYPVLQVSLNIIPPATSAQAKQCFKLKESKEARSLWQAPLNMFDSPGLYRGVILLTYETPEGRTGYDTQSFERYRYLVEDDQTQTPPVVIVDPDPGNQVDFDLGVLGGVDFDSDTRSQPVVGAGISLFTYGRKDGRKLLAFPILSLSGRENRQWVSLSPVAINLGRLLTRGFLLSDLWLHGGGGFIVNDGRLRSSTGSFVFVTGLRTRF